MAPDEHPPLTLIESELWSVLFERGYSGLSIRNTDRDFIIFAEGRDEPITLSKDSALAAYQAGTHRPLLEGLVA